MAPRARRKLFTLTFIPLLILLALSTGASAASAVLGIDLGTEYIKAAIAKPGSPIDIVLTKDSKRKEAATLAFKPSGLQTKDENAFPERLYGGDAIALSARYPADVFPNLKSLLGIPRFSDQVKTYTERYPGIKIESVPRFEEGNVRGTVGFKSQNAGSKSEVYMVEELLAMQLKNIKANAQTAVAKGTYVDEAVITYPPFFTAEEKRAIELAADLAGLRLLALVSDGLAVGFNYASSRNFDGAAAGKNPEYHVVYDMGAGSTKATVLKIQAKTVKVYGGKEQNLPEIQVVGTGYDRTLGGDALNDAVVEDMLNKFVAAPRVKKLGLQAVHVRKHGKSMARLWKDAEKVRQVLSANSMAATSFEGLYYEDVNFKYSITRDEFEKLAASHAARVEFPLIQALNAAGVELINVDSIILHGGAVRTPFVQKQLEIVVGGSNKIKTNVNADEAAAMGAAFKAASISPSFRVKQIRGIDISGTAIAVKWDVDGKDKQQKLFTQSSQVGLEKQVPLKVLSDTKFEFVMLQDDSSSSIVEVEATNLTNSVAELQKKYSCSSANITSTFIVRLSPLNGLPEIVSGSVSCPMNTSREGGVLENVKGLFGFGSKKSGDQAVLQEDAGEEDISETSTPLPVDDPTSSATTLFSASASETATTSTKTSSTTEKTSKKPKSTVATIPLSFKTSAVGLNAPPKKNLNRIRARLSAFDASDRDIVHRAEALNSLESFSYKIRDYLEDQGFISSSSESIRADLQEKLSGASDWLYGDGADAKLEELKERLKGLRTIVDPIIKRQDESKKRPEALESLRSALANMSGMIRMVESSIKRTAEEAASSISAAASSATEAVASIIPSAEGDDLEDDPYKSSSTNSKETPIPAAYKPYEYDESDLSLLQTAHDAVKSWLDENLPLQEKLTAYDNPVVLVDELKAKAKLLTSATSEMVMKAIKANEQANKKAEKEKKAASRKASQSKTKTKSSKTAKSSTASTTTSTGTATGPTPTAKKDEL